VPTAMHAAAQNIGVLDRENMSDPGAKHEESAPCAYPPATTSRRAQAWSLKRAQKNLQQHHPNDRANNAAGSTG